MISFFSTKKSENDSPSWETKGHPKDFTLEGSSTIGLLFDATKEASLFLVNDFISAVKQKGYRLNVMSEGVDERLILCRKMRFSQYTSKDFSLLNVPKNPAIDVFTKEKNDIFIDFTLNKRKTTVRIRKSVHATIKIGINIQENTFDFSFTISPKNVSDNVKAFKQMLQYLEKINK